ncbi:hypothetical protein HYPSUDRAFT_65826 [Hypholoma sublateritium FD-334 SS-4]|uniref:Peptidase A1 domain-containing protein n=1 Tax=Hypholoma sublateritium (strain FD-334 SS-4) TaxID=945553 RepID=A0A0D2PX34_HYPSF|nr:hypothetical protein HYPSUDRAFT_65826 [Hypholoma sublateritium FD-334 SS-4]
MFNGVYLTTLVLFSIFLTRIVAHHRKQCATQPSIALPAFEVAITTIGAPKYDHYKAEGSKRILGIGNNLDLERGVNRLYTVPVELGGKVFHVNLDTGSSDLWLVSDKCHTNACRGASVARYPTSFFRTTSMDVEMLYGDSKSGTFASGTVGLDTASIAGIALPRHPFALIEDTNNLLVQFGASGIFGLSFPAASTVQAALLGTEEGSDIDVDDYVHSIESNGPLLSRMTEAKVLDIPTFSISLERHTNGLDGKGLLTIGNLPEGIDNSSLTWVPVRLYPGKDGGMGTFSAAPEEVRWEIEIDGVFLEGQRLPESTTPANGVDSERVSALIDTGNSLLRGPEDVVVKILQTLSPRFDPNVAGSVPSVPCGMAPALSFQIGGQMFPIDPRDFVSQLDPEDAVACQADNLVPTDPPSYGNLFRWSLGTPFFRSNLVVFHYGNLTHPSVDPPRIGLRSNVPANAYFLMREAVKIAAEKGTSLLSRFYILHILD